MYRSISPESCACPFAFASVRMWIFIADTLSTGVTGSGAVVKSDLSQFFMYGIAVMGEFSLAQGRGRKP